MNTLTNMGAMFFLNAFAFLEKSPNFKCKLDSQSDVWTYSREIVPVGDEQIATPLEEEYCSGKYTCAIDWDDS